MLAIGQHAFIGIGAYTIVIYAYKSGLNLFMMIPLAGLIALLFAIPIFFMRFRLRDTNFVVGTWVMAETLRLLVSNINWLGGDSSLSITSAMQGIPRWSSESLTLWFFWHRPLVAAW